MTRGSVDPEQVSGDTVGVVPLFGDVQGCEKFAQRVLSFAPGGSSGRVEEADDEVLYVVAGRGTATVGEARMSLEPGLGVFVRHGVEWSVEADEELDILSVLIRDPDPAPGPGYAVVDLGSEARKSATAARQFVLGVWAEAGCPSVTQFIGFVPPGRAPDHFHRYDEVLYILTGRGTLHIDGEEAPLSPGACVFLPATLVHSLENTGDHELELLGVFRPSGSPAEAYYPDGSPAAYPEE